MSIQHGTPVNGAPETYDVFRTVQVGTLSTVQMGTLGSTQVGEVIIQNKGNNGVLYGPKAEVVQGIGFLLPGKISPEGGATAQVGGMATLQFGGNVAFKSVSGTNEIVVLRTKYQ